jgi:hypothetical protein
LDPTPVEIGWASQRRTAPADIHQMLQDLFNFLLISGYGYHING